MNIRTPRTPPSPRRRDLAPRNARVWMRQVDISNLLAWAAANDGPTEAEILQGVEAAAAREVKGAEVFAGAAN